MASEDKITTLPDDVLFTILSLLTFKKAVATSILSRRWRYLWTSLPSLHFRYEYVVQRDDKDNVLQHYRRVNGVYKDRCIQMVNQLLRGRKGQELQEFGIHYPLLESSACHIDLWVAFAIAIGVSKLELNFSPYPHLLPISLNKNYSIPLDLFDKAKGMEPYLVQLEHAFSIPTSSLNVQNRFKSLRELILKFVDLTDEHFEAILSNCTSLEFLHLHSSSRLVNLKHTVPHMKLKCLEIFHCRNLEKVEVFAPNLVSFKYQGSKIQIFVKDAKQLLNLCMCSYIGELEYPLENSLGLPHMQSKDFVFGQFAAHLSRLEYLMMDVSSFEGKQQFNKLPLFSNLKHLSLTCSNSSRGPCGMLRCYHTVACFVEASPFLHRLELHFHLGPTKNPELRRIAISPHRYLKEVLVSGFFGNKLAKDIILSIFNFAIELEKIEITTVFLYDLSKRPFKNSVAVNEVVRRCMGQLHQRLPENAQLHFLDDDRF
ncbi:hypothetical protein V6N13_080888 [Hibiscus sabdariffa]|uniref:Uncharacterized protein n=2 Tax=Hibiscus sabdariffa TaxID=183260 RepID=A0ABR2NSY0_9ROSI